MRKVWKWLGMVSLAVVLVACDSELVGKPPFTIDPVVDYANWLDCRYPIDSTGYCPVAAEVDFADQLKSQVVGHGWIHDFTFEIDEKGYCEPTNYYEGLIGGGPHHFYFDSEEALTVFLYIDARPAIGFYTTPYRYDEAQNSVWIQPEALKGEELRCFQLVHIQDDSEVEPARLYALVHLGISGGSGKEIYGLSIYHRATPEELAQLREDYPDDLSKLQ